MTDLQKAARVALDALIEMTQPQRTASESDRYKRVKAAMSALESALPKQADQVAVQAEPVAAPEPLTVAEIEQMNAQWNYEIHGDRTRYLVRMTEKAHGIGEKE